MQKLCTFMVVAVVAGAVVSDDAEAGKRKLGCCDAPSCCSGPMRPDMAPMDYTAPPAASPAVPYTPSVIQGNTHPPVVHPQETIGDAIPPTIAAPVAPPVPEAPVKPQEPPVPMPEKPMPQKKAQGKQGKQNKAKQQKAKQAAEKARKKAQEVEAPETSALPPADTKWFGGTEHLRRNAPIYRTPATNYAGR